MTKHTPGPWTNHGRQANERGLPHSAVAAKTLLARVYSEAFGDVEQETANARLIAAAPELLAALQSIAECCDEDHAARDYASRQTEIRGIARAAIQKATKEQQRV